MREMIKMVVVLTCLSAISGGLLAKVEEITKPQIENQRLVNVKGPALKAIFADASNDVIADRFTLPDGETERTFFVGVVDGEPRAVAFENYGKGYGGDVGFMIGIDLKDDTVIGASVTTHSETPGFGSRAKSDPKFAAQFSGMSVMEPFQTTKDGGQVNAVSGATITSRAVCTAATTTSEAYQRLKDQLLAKAQEYK